MKKLAKNIPSLFALFFLCGSGNSISHDNENHQSDTEMPSNGDGIVAVVDVATSGSENEINFSVTLSSNDTGCSQYADWWEVIDLDGNLLFRRILAHSHVNEQPFTRSGGPGAILSDTEVYIRGHMNNSGYGKKVYRGTVNGGFKAFDLDSDFAKELEDTQPLPGNCNF